MKMLILVVGMMLCIFTTTISSTTVNGRFVVISADSAMLSVLLQINTNTGNDEMGGATIVLGFDKTLLNFSSSPQRNSDYIFHNFSGGNYSPATITKPKVDKIWVNIDLPFNNSNSGSVVSGENEWTDLVTIYFNIIGTTDSVNLYWQPENPFWGIYDADNSTLWNAGEFENLSGRLNINFDDTPPELLNAELIDSVFLELTFSEALDSTSALEKQNYSINNGITVTDAFLSTNLNRVILKTTEHASGQTYIITAQNIFDLAGNLLSDENNSFEYLCLTDSVSPTVSGITVNNTQSITVKFSERIDINSAKNKSNYAISDNIIVNQVQVLPDSSGVLLKTTKQSVDKDYTLTVTNVKDRNGNTISPNPSLKPYKTPQKQKGKPTKTRINAANSDSWYLDYSPEKSIDGQGMNNPDSRWQSANVMPASIQYDLGDPYPLDSIRISFHKWDAGRLYEYSIYSSDDSVNWTPVVEEIWSDNLEWTEIIFDSINARFIKLDLLQSNQNPFASIWEIEMFGAEKSGDETNINTLPESFELSQNYPNPFNPSTKIAVSLPQAGEMKLVVYNILGEVISELANSEFTAGTHEFNFDAAGLASGVYVYRIESVNFIETKKMILLR